MTNYTIALQSIPARGTRPNIDRETLALCLERRATAIEAQWPAEAAKARAQAARLREGR